MLMIRRWKIEAYFIFTVTAKYRHFGKNIVVPARFFSFLNRRDRSQWKRDEEILHYY